MDNSGLMRVRSMTTLSRRDAMKGAAALGALAATGLSGRKAAAATNVSMFGWQDYDAGLRVGDFLKQERHRGHLHRHRQQRRDHQPAGRRRRRADRHRDALYGLYPVPGGVGSDRAHRRIAGAEPAKVPEVFRNDSNVIVDGKRYSVPFTWGSAPMAYDPAVIPTAPEFVDGHLQAGIQGQGRHGRRSHRQPDAGRHPRDRRRGADHADAGPAEPGDRIPDQAEEGRRRGSWR